MVVGTLRLELHLHAPQSLKEKRSVVKRLLGRCRERFPVSCAEVEHQDLWQRATLGFAVVEHGEGPISALFERIEAEVIRSGEVDICASDNEFIHY
jgi:uncharacterized protein YlxP (DUF503 family)